MKRSDYLTPLDARDPAFIENPYPFFERVLAAGPIHRDSMGIWYVMQHADCRALLTDRQRISRDDRNWSLYDKVRPAIAGSTLERTVQQWMLQLDPPAHTRLRGLVNKAFTPAAVAAMRGQIETTAATLIAGLKGRSRFDLMAGLAEPLPVRVICDMLGLPPDDYASTKRWSDLLVWVLEPSAPWARRQEADRACTEMLAYLRGQLAHARALRRDDLLGHLIAAHEDADRLSEDELLANIVLLFLAGHETTTNLIGNGLLALLRHPDQLARLRADPSLMDSAIDELLRFDGPVTLAPRVAAQPITIGDQTMMPGDLMQLVLGAAHRDPAAFADPGRLDLARAPNHHLAFGAGLHYCLGAPLARLEASVALQALLDAFPALAVAEGGVCWRRITSLRGCERLELEALNGTA